MSSGPTPSVPQALWAHPFSLLVHHSSLISYTSNLYDIPDQPSIIVNPSPTMSSFHLHQHQRGKVVDEEFQIELFKYNITVLGSFLTDLFDIVVCTGLPPLWSRHIIHLIHKIGLASDPNNYRIVGWAYFL